MVYNLIDNCILLSDKKFQHDNIQIAKKFLICNNYPSEFINKYITKRICHLKNNNVQNNDKVNSIDWLILPFYKHLNQNIINNLKNLNVIIINKNINKFNNLIKLGKDKLEKMETRDIVYKIKCKNCDYVYIGQSGRKLRKRIVEHKTDYENKHKDSIFYKHQLRTNHDFDFNETTIINTESNYYKRTFSEMSHIQIHQKTLNRKQDTQHLKYFLKNTINLIKKRVRRR